MGRKLKTVKLVEQAANTVNANSMAAGKAQAIVRRSRRLQNLSCPGQVREIDPAGEVITLSESEKEDEPHVEESPPASAPSEWSTEEKISYLMQAVEELKSKAAKTEFQSDNPASDLKYKNMYIHAQKKIEALTNENYELSKKLDVALGKIEAYTEAKYVCSEMLDKLKDMLQISTLAKANETASLSELIQLMRIDPNKLRERRVQLIDTGQPHSLRRSKRARRVPVKLLD